MARLLDPMAIYDRGLAELDSLSGAERFVFMLQDFDNLMEMEGWDHFFLYEHHFAWYSEMKDWLRRIGDESSLAVLSNYESHVSSNGFEVSPSGIEALLKAKDENYYRTCPDWCGRYCDLREARWARASAFFMSQGLALQTGEPVAEAGGGE